MQISGEVLDVKDGDAIIVVAEKNNEKLLIIIDGGDRGHENSIVQKVEEYCTRLNKEAPDLLVCTHYDSDHIAGLIGLVKHYKGKIKNIWIHQPKGAVKEALKTAGPVLEHISDNSKFLNFNEHALLHYYLAASQNDKYKLVIEGVGQLKTLLDLIKDYNINTEQPIAEECSIPGWQEIVIIGPTQQYFDKVFPQDKSLISYFQEEYEELILENAKQKYVNVDNPCALLKTTSKITATNKASTIIRFDCADGKYLFTGDAGIESLKATIGYPNSITNMKFLKIPHHGSNNNMSSELVNIINPQIAYSSGDEYEDPEVIACFRSKPTRTVKTTKELGDLSF